MGKDALDKTVSKLDDEVNRVLESPSFLSSPNLTSLLRYLATNQATGLKESVIAGEFFGRADYDSKIDSLVRTEVRRLRLKLVEHYAKVGEAWAARLEIPKGSYDVVLHEVAVPSPQAVPVIKTVADGHMRLVFGVSAAIAVLALLVGDWLIRRPALALAGPPRAVAVLPFSVVEPFLGKVDQPKSLKMDATGLSDDLVARLAAKRTLRVTARSSTAGFKDSAATVQEIGKALGVEVLVRGSARAGTGGTIILTATAVAVDTGRQLWSGQAGGQAERLSALEDRLAAGLLSSLGLDPSSPPYQPKQDALDAYLDARLLMHTPTPANTEKALKLLEHSAKLDPAFALPLINSASIYLVAANNGLMDPAVVTPKARLALERSLAIDPLSADAHVVEGDLRYSEFDWEGARKAYFRAIDLNPSSANAYYDLACQLMAERRFDEAETNLRQASQLSPLWYGPAHTLIELRYYQKRYKQAIEESAIFNSRFPNMADRFIEAKARLRLGDRGKLDIERLRKGQPPLLGDVFTAIYEGKKDVAIELIRKAALLKQGKDPHYVSAFALACMWAEVGDHEQAIAWLEKSFKAKEPDVVSLNIEPAFDGIREDPRCRMILRQLRLRSGL